MKNIVRFSVLLYVILFSQCGQKQNDIIMTVNGPVEASQMGTSLVHEHILVDFIGADSTSYSRWNKSDVAIRALPFLNRIKNLGCRTFVDCTPEFIGRDPVLLKMLSESSGLNIMTNTGYYGASDDKYIPKHAYTETADQLALRWTSEWINGIEDTGVKPGFIKIGVATGSLSDLHKKLIAAAARTHLNSGLTIVSHTGPAIPAFEQLEILRKEGVNPEAFIWVHAQAEKDLDNHIKAAKMGAWIELDGLNGENVEEYVKMLRNLKDNNLLDHVLLSHDAGWYRPGEVNGGEYRGYTDLFEKLIPQLMKEGFSEKEIKQILVINPARAFTVRVRKI
jgi:phosphotriesterase-related protein